MKMKKNGVSYLLWFLYSVLMASLSTIFIYSICAGIFGMSIVVVTIMAVIFFLFVAGVNIYGRKMVEKIQAKYPRFANRARNGEYVFWVLTLVGAIGYRFYLAINYVGSMSEEYLFYRIALERTPSVSAAIIHRLTGLYTYVLSQLSVFFGDQMVVGVIFNAAVQIIGMTFLYVGIKILAGRVPALLSMVFVGFSSYSVYTLYNLTPVSLYFMLFAIGLFIVARLLKRERTRKIQKTNVIGFVLAGIYLGFVIYQDLVGIVLLILGGMIFVIKDRKIDAAPEESKAELLKSEKKKSMIQYGSMLCGAVVFFIGAIIFDAVRWQQGFGQAITEFFAEYAKTMKFQVSFTGVSIVPAIIVSFMGALLIIGFWMNKKQKSDAWVLALAVLCFMEYGGMAWMNYQFFTGIVFVVLAGLGLMAVGPEREELKNTILAQPAKPNDQSQTQAPVRDAEPAAAPASAPAQEIAGTKTSDAAAEEVKPEEVKIEETKVEEVKIEEAKAEEIKIEEVKPEEVKINYIENPLPLPKKHEKKEMNFDKNFEAAENEYDVATSEEDDFDL